MEDEKFESIRHCFDKKYVYQSYENSNIAHFEINKAKKWRCDDLYSLKTYLNNIKGQLDDFNLGKWRPHTFFTHKASNILPSLKKIYKPGLLTQAWCKFREILCKFPQLVNLNNTSFNSLHLCEAPGAFVASLDFYLNNKGWFQILFLLLKLVK